MTKTERAAARERCEAATAGPWYQESGRDRARYGFRIYAADFRGVCKPTAEMAARDEANSTFIAHARTDLPAALDELDRLTAANAALKAKNAKLMSERDKAQNELARVVDKASNELLAQLRKES